MDIKTILKYLNEDLTRSKSALEKAASGEAGAPLTARFVSNDFLKSLAAFEEPSIDGARDYFKNPEYFQSGISFPWNLLRFYLSHHLLSPSSGKTELILDVGACQGDWTFGKLGDYVVSESTQILSFEPNPANCSIIERRQQELDSIKCPSPCSPCKSLPTSQCVLYPYALSDERSSMDLLTLSGKNRPGHETASLHVAGDGWKSIAKVKVERLDYVLADYGKPEDININFMKIDAEGTDPLVIIGMGDYLKSVQFFQFELNLPLLLANPLLSDNPLKDIVDYLDAKGFNVYLLGLFKPLCLTEGGWHDVYNTCHDLPHSDLFVSAKSNPVIAELTNDSGEWLTPEEVCLQK